MNCIKKTLGRLQHVGISKTFSLAHPHAAAGLVVLASFAGMFLGPGLTNSYGVFEEEYENLYSNSRTGAKGSISPAISIGAVHLASNYLFTTIAGALCERLGMGLTTFIGAIMVGTGLVHSGSGVGGLVLAPLTRFLINTHELSGSVKILGLALAAGLSVISLGMASKPDELFDQEDEDSIDAVSSTGDNLSEHKASSLAKKRMSVRSFGVRDVRSTGGVLRSQEFWYLNVAVMLAEAAFY
ncbi:hypothetical protein H4S02_007183, partial [Coemansia sp. RSA 2611]